MKTIGIYFSKDHCFALEAIDKRGQYTCEQFFKIPYAQDKITALAHFASRPHRYKRVILGISHHLVQTQRITLDSTLSENEIIHYLKSKIETPFFDYEILNQQGEKISLQIISVSEKVIKENQTLFHAAKLPLHVIDTDKLSLHRLTNYLARINDREKLFTTSQLPQQDPIYFFITMGLAFWGAC